PSRAFSRDSLRRRVVALLASAPGPDTTKGAPRGRLVVVGSGDFASDRYTRNSPENLVFVENAIDWLAQDDALIAIRSKNRAPPPLVFTSATTRGAVKYGNVIGVPVLLVGAGFLLPSRRGQPRRPVVAPLPRREATAHAPCRSTLLPLPGRLRPSPGRNARLSLARPPRLRGGAPRRRVEGQAHRRARARQHRGAGCGAREGPLHLEAGRQALDVERAGNRFRGRRPLPRPAEGHYRCGVRDAQ